jgi:hypothetical protein
MERQRRVVGAFLKIILPDGKYCYGRILEKANYAFYDMITEDGDVDLMQITKHKILFIIAVYNDAVTSGRWIKIGKLPLEPELQILPLKFIQDKLNPEHFEFYDPNTGSIKTATRQDCMGLERAAVWEPYHVEERIVNYLMMNPAFG